MCRFSDDDFDTDGELWVREDMFFFKVKVSGPHSKMNCPDCCSEGTVVLTIENKTKEVIRMEKLTMTVEEAGKLLGIGKSSAYEAVRNGSIPSIRIGRRFLIPRIAIDSMMASVAVQIDQAK